MYTDVGRHDLTGRVVKGGLPKCKLVSLSYHDALNSPVSAAKDTFEIPSSSHPDIRQTRHFDTRRAIE